MRTYGIILLVGVISLVFFLFERSSKSVSEKSINFYLGEGAPLISVDPAHGDIMTNMALSHQIITTLLLFSSDGLFVPFGAESWIVSKSGLQYNFRIRPGMFDELGNSLTAEYYVRGLHKLLRLHAEKGDPPDFSFLIGWSKFRVGESETISGIKVSSIFDFQMEFERKPTSLLKYLSMPKFGFVHPKDFEGSRWREPLAVTSTSFYKIGEVSDDSKIVKLHANISHRSNFPSHAPIHAVFKRKNIPPTGDVFSNSMAMFINTASIQYHPQGDLVFGPPIILTFLALSPYLRPFENSKFRERFYRCLRARAQEVWLDSEIIASRITTTFYPSSQQGVAVDKLGCGDFLKISRGKPHALKAVFSAQLSEDERSYVKSILLELFSEDSLVIETEDRSRPNWLAEVQSYKSYHIRVAAVSTGAQYINWAVKMMFCGKLGIGLPDPSGLICRNVDRVDSQGLDASEANRQLEYSIIRDSSVLPLYYSSISWLVSKDIKINEKSQINYYPLFKDIEI